jgi:activator of 2-hydroxyglutaryl-CoA dehydratase
VGIRERVVFAGGAAFNNCLRQLVGGKLGVELAVPSQPQIVGALGAALQAKQEDKQKVNSEISRTQFQSQGENK